MIRVLDQYIFLIEFEIFEVHLFKFINTLLANSFCCKLDAEENVVAFAAPVAEGMSDARDFECNKVKVLADSDIP